MISVVVPTRGRPAALARCLAALAVQEAGELEVIVADDGGDAVAHGVRIVRTGGSGPAAARNAGALAARGDVICFTDDDCAPAPRWAQRLADACPPGGAAAGATIADPAAGRAAAAAQLLTNTLVESTRDRARGTLGFAPTCNLACRAETLRGLPFDESFAAAAGEDRDWCARLAAAGGELRHAPGAVVVHRPELGVRGLVAQGVRYGRGAVGFRDAGGTLAGAGFYGRLARACVREGPAVAALVALAQASVAAGAAREAIARRGR